MPLTPEAVAHNVARAVPPRGRGWVAEWLYEARAGVLRRLAGPERIAAVAAVEVLRGFAPMLEAAGGDECRAMAAAALAGDPVEGPAAPACALVSPAALQLAAPFLLAALG